MTGIEAKRRLQGLTQAALAKKLKVDQTSVSKWESGLAKPRADKLLAMAAILNCTIDELLKESA
jgi:transcriptional regulator with XRE-family HTH domain